MITKFEKHWAINDYNYKNTPSYSYDEFKKRQHMIEN